MDPLGKTRCLIALIVLGVLAVGPWMSYAASSQAFLGIDELADGWISHYGNINSMEVAYHDHLVDFVPSEDSEEPSPVQDLHVERVEQGTRYQTRYSMAEGGFTQEEDTLTQAFDGETTTEYSARYNAGVLRSGLTGRACETMNDVRRHMLLDIVRTKIHPEGVLRCQHCLTRSDAVVQPELESILGEPCHVVENAWEGGHIRIWLAHDKGFLPLKYEKVVDGRFRDERVVQEIASVETETGLVWFPIKAERTVFSPSVGTVKTALAATKFIPNVPVSDEMFRVRFPVGAHVLDRIRDIDYVMGIGADASAELDLLDSEGIAAKTDVNALATDETVHRNDNDLPVEDIQPLDGPTEVLADTSSLTIWSIPAMVMVGVVAVIALGLLVRKRFNHTDEGGM